jgi:hypothetical protein
MIKATSMTDGFLSFFNLGSLNLEYLQVDDRVKRADRVNTWNSNTPSQNA